LSNDSVLPRRAVIAQWTSTRSWPCAFRAFSKPATALSSLMMLTLQKTPPISFATASPAASLMSKMATFAPAAASACALALPRPEAPPVTTAETFLSIFIAETFRM
jgi:hypothetical protein